LRDERAAPSFVPTLRSNGGPVQQAPQRLTYASASTAAFRTLRSYDFRIFNGITAVATGPTLTVVEPVLWRDANVVPDRAGLLVTIHDNGSSISLLPMGREVRQGEPIIANRHSPG